MMLDMVKKNGVAPPREGTAAAMREVVQSGSTPGLATAEQARRRWFSAEYKRRVLQAADAAAAPQTAGTAATMAAARPWFGARAAMAMPALAVIAARAISVPADPRRFSSSIIGFKIISSA
jgi:hypothetical protein